MKPVIGICTDHVRHILPVSDDDPSAGHADLAIRDDMDVAARDDTGVAARDDTGVAARDRSYLKLYPEYARAIAGAGGTPLVIPILPDVESVRPLLGLVQGVMLTGADDYPAEWFGGTTLPTDVPVTPERAGFDRAFARLLLEETSLPVLGICGGMQLMAIHAGGSLIQDLPQVSPVRHRAGAQGISRHGIEITPGSRLAEVLGATRIEVNSQHHQAVEHPGAGLRVTARAEDGVIEALEDEGHPFRLGVQWHPERMAGDEFMARLFAAFVAACAVQLGSA